MDSVSNILRIKFMGNSLEEYAIALGVFLAIWIGLRVFRGVVLNKLETMAQKTATKLDDKLVQILENISGLFYAFLAFYIMFKMLNLDGVFEKYLDAAFIILVIYEAVKAAQVVLEVGLDRVTTTKNATAIHGIQLIAKIILWSIGILVILSNLGFDITALAASLGVGGIAIALAAQNILSDLFASFSIYFDKPFQIGDFIVIGTDKGEVKKIGMKTTRILTLQGEELVVSNKELTEARVQNFKKMKRRRIVFPFGVEYGTPTKKLKKIPEIVEKIIKKETEAEFDRATFTTFGDFSLNYEVVFFMDTSDYLAYAQTQERINLAILEAFEKEKIEMAFPTQTIYLKKA